MGRNKKIYPQQVLENLEENGTRKIGDLANDLDCCIGTVRHRVRELRNEGKVILPTPDGLMLVDVVNEENGPQIRKSGNWIIGEIVGISNISKVAKKPIMQVRKVIELSKAERNELRRMLLYITKMIDFVDIDEDLELIKQ